MENPRILFLSSQSNEYKIELNSCSTFEILFNFGGILAIEAIQFFVESVKRENGNKKCRKKLRI